LSVVYETAVVRGRKRKKAEENRAAERMKG
jgi:hypothetical protein